MIPRISVTGPGDYTRNVGYKTGSIDFSYETKTFGYDRGIKLLADVMDVEEAGVMDCFVQAGAEPQRTQVAPEADAYTFASIAGHAGMAEDNDDFSDAEAADVLARLREVTSEMDEAQVSSGSRILFIMSTLKGVLDDYSLANPARSNRVLERFSMIVEVPQARFWTNIELLSGDGDHFGYARDGRGRERAPGCVARGSGHHELRLLVQRVLGVAHGRGLREPGQGRGRDADVYELLGAAYHHGDLVRPLHDQEGRERALRVHTPRGRDGRLRPHEHERVSVLKVGAGGLLTHPEDDSRTWLNATLFGDGELLIGFARADAAGREVVASGDVCTNARYTAIMCAPWSGASKQVRRETIAEEAPRLAAVNLNYWFYGCTALESVEGLSRLRGVSCMNYAFSTCSALTSIDLRGLDPSSLSSLSYTFSSCSSLATILVDASWALPKGYVGSQTFYGCKALVGGNGTAFSSGNAGYAMIRVDAEGTPGYLTAG